MAIDIKFCRKELEKIAEIDRFSPVSGDRESRYKDTAWQLLGLLEESYRLLEDLTPQGSEFYNNPKGCAEFVRQRYKQEHQLIVKWKKENDQLKKEVDRLKDEIHGLKNDRAGKAWEGSR